MIHLDTHVVVWLHAGQPERLPAAARAHLRARRPVVSPIVRLELQYLREIGRLRVPPARVLDDLRALADLGSAESPFGVVTARAQDLQWTRDPFDRIIAAHALADDVPLLTADARMLEHCPVACWG